MSKQGICANCKRDTSIVAFDLCGVCYGASKGILRGSPECDAALEAARKKVAAWESSADKAITKMRSHRPGRKPIPAKKSTLTMLEDRRHALMNEITEINQAIEVIKRLKAA